MSFFATKSTNSTISLTSICTGEFDDWLIKQDARVKSWIAINNFTAKPGQTLLLPNPEGMPSAALLGVENGADLWSWGGAASQLPEGRYEISNIFDEAGANRASLGWALGQYNFDKYKNNETLPRELIWPKSANQKLITSQIDGIFLTRDLINTPANNMGPEELANSAMELAKKHKAKCRIIKGDKLLSKNFPLIHAVGRASVNEPRLIDLQWGNIKSPKLTLVGKGVCFDSGGLDLKPSNGMLLMKKDMGGAANVLGLAHMIMSMEIDVNLRVLIPAVENSVSGDAFRPMDILPSRQGKTVEIGNTDAEGRLVLADALTLAAEDQPDLIVDFATLTGAARVALGTDLPACFTTDEDFATTLSLQSEKATDPTWRMPLFAPYAKLLDSKIADINNAPASGYGGAITAALFLKGFLPDSQNWVHFDLMAWNLSSRPGRPEGGEAQAIRAVFNVIQNRYI